MRAMSGSPQFVPSQRLPNVGHADFAERLGLLGSAVDDPGQVRDAWRWALNADRPCVLEFATDPAVPPIPPHANREQMESMASALLKGDPESWSVVKEGVKSKVQEFRPRT